MNCQVGADGDIDSRTGVTGNRRVKDGDAAADTGAEISNKNATERVTGHRHAFQSYGGPGLGVDEHTETANRVGELGVTSGDSAGIGVNAQAALRIQGCRDVGESGGRAVLGIGPEPFFAVAVRTTLASGDVISCSINVDFDSLILAFVRPAVGEGHVGC